MSAVPFPEDLDPRPEELDRLPENPDRLPKELDPFPEDLDPPLEAAPDVAPPHEEPTAEEVYFPREFSDLLTALARAIQKHSMYPPVHPALRPAVDAVWDGLRALLKTRDAFSVEIGRNQIAIEGTESRPDHPRFAPLAGLLHRHQLAAITFFPGIREQELGEFLAILATEPERARQVVGQAVAEGAGPQWEHIQLHAIRYADLDIARRSAPEARSDPEQAAKLWLGLARAALQQGQASGNGGDDPAGAGFDPEALANALERQAGRRGYAAEVMSQLASLSKELSVAQGEEAGELRQRASRFVSLITPDTLRQILTLGGAAPERQQLLRDAAGWMEPESMVKLVRAAAGVERKDVSHWCLLMMLKLARYSREEASDIGRQAESNLRQQVDELVSGWMVEDAIPEEYATALEKLSMAPAGAVAYGSDPDGVEPLRIVQMSIELDKAGAKLAGAVSVLVRNRRFSELFHTLEEAPEGNSTARLVRDTVCTPETAVRILEAAEPDFEALDRVIAHIGAKAAPPMLEALASAESRAVRRQLFTRLGTMGPAVGRHIVGHLDDGRWYVRRNMLALLDGVEEWPPGWSPTEYTRDRHPAVRREALKLLLRVRPQRDWALRELLEERDPRSLALGLGAAQEEAPPEVFPHLVDVVTDEPLGWELRAMAARALARFGSEDAVDALLLLVSEQGGRLRRLLRLHKLRPTSQFTLETIAALARHCRGDPRVQRLLRLAAKSEDPRLRIAARGRSLE